MTEGTAAEGGATARTTGTVSRRRSLPGEQVPVWA